MSAPAHRQPEDAALGSGIPLLTGPRAAADAITVLNDAYVALTAERTRFFNALGVPAESPELWAREILLYVEGARAQHLRRKQEELTDASVWARASPAYTQLKQEYNGLQSALSQARQQYSDVRGSISSHRSTLSPYERSRLRERMRDVRSYILLNGQVLRGIRSRLSTIRLCFKVLTRPWPRFNRTVESMKLDNAQLSIQFASPLHSLREITESSRSVFEYACAHMSPAREVADDVDGLSDHVAGVLKMQAILQSQVLQEMQSKLRTALSPPVDFERPIRDVSIDTLVDVSALCEQLQEWLGRVREQDVVVRERLLEIATGLA